MLLMNASTPNITHLLGMSTSATAAAMKGLVMKASDSHALAGVNTSGQLVVNASSLHHALPADWPSPFLPHAVLVTAVVANCFLYISPLRLGMRALRENVKAYACVETREVDVKAFASWLMPAYVLFAQNFLWATYGYSTGLSDLARVNTFGALVCMSYFGLIASSAQPRGVAQAVVLLSLMAIVTFSVGVLAMSSSLSARSHAFAYTAMLFNIGMLLAPSPDIVSAVRTGAWQEVPVAMTVASFFSSLLWVLYAVLIHDHLFLVANVVGVVICGAELLVIYWIACCGGASGGAQSLLREVEGQPLMPRARGNDGRSSCSDVFGLIGSRLLSYRPWRRAGEHKIGTKGANIYENAAFIAPRCGVSGTKLWEKPLFNTFSEASPISSLLQKKMPSVPSCPKFMKKSPFSAFDSADGLEGFTEEVQNQSRLVDEFAFTDGENQRPYRAGATDCTL